VKTVSVERLLDFIFHRMIVVNNPADRDDAQGKLCAMVARDQLGIVVDEINSGRLSPDPAVPVGEPAGDGGLLPCPFCGSECVNDTSEPTDEPHGTFFWVCPACVACGPVSTSLEGATVNWNTRAHGGRGGWLPIELNNETSFILGIPNFKCAYTAEKLRSRGHNIPRKAEAEQAAVICWMLNLYLKHGPNWREQFMDENIPPPPRRRSR
jgi:hypothetical protein